jgi:ABC-2 type transport system ATP-binding protein
MIRVDDLTKDYGPTRALDSISFQVEDRQILGFLGPNGAGKSTAMKNITTYLSPTSGKVTVDGIDVTADPLAVRRKIGYLPETNPLYPDMRVQDYLSFCGRARGLDGSQLKQRHGFVVEKCGLRQMLKKNINELSKGYKQRTGLAQALIHDPQILILDEPTSGLDPLQIIEIRSLIQELSKEKTIIFSTHILQEASSTTDRVIIINSGRIIADGYASELQRQAAGREKVRASLRAERGKVEVEMRGLSGVADLQILGERDGVVTVDLVTDQGDSVREGVGALAARQGWPVLELSMPSISLEQTFIELIRKSREGAGGSVHA